MVRASTRSKTAASVDAAKTKAATPKKQAPKKAVVTPLAAVAAHAKPASKITPKPKVKIERKATRTSPRKAGLSEPADEPAEVDAEPEADGSGEKEVALQIEDENPPKEEAQESPPPEDLVQAPLATDEEEEKIWCICHGTDDGTPMITCECCDNWFHFHCIALKESDAEEIVTWEITDDEKGLQSPVEEATTGDRTKKRIRVLDDLGDEASSAAESSEDDEYVDEYRRAKRNQRTTSSRIVHRSSSASTAASRSPSRSPSTSRPRHSSSRADFGKPVTHRKRKSISHAVDPEPSKKRVKASSLEERPNPTAADDPVRKYCLGKLRDIVTPIFLARQKDAVDAETTTEVTSEPEPQDDESQKTEAGKKAAIFTQELEQCVFEIFAEPDKKGRKTAGPKYKERFRMLTFNLEKEDRTELRHKIASGAITPSELSRMSSADLANEQLQQQIESAHLASLRHSILEAKTAAPRAKITHKGEEMIEDMQGYLAPGPAEPKALTEAEEAHAKQQHDDDMAGVEDYPHTDSPIAMDSAISPTIPTDLPSASASGFDISEVLGDMGLPSGDMEGLSSASSPFKHPSSSSTIPPLTIPSTTSGYSGPSSARSMSMSGASPSNPNALLASALLSASQSAPSFNLDSVWGSTGTPASLPPNSQVTQAQEPTPQEEEMRDTDFDMFFDRGELFEPTDEPELMEADPTTAPDDAGKNDEMADFEALPIVWTGNVQMPVEPASAWTTTVRARQIGGRNLGDSLATWKKLFTQPITRIDGRVPIANATKYLVDIRFNPSKELVAVALSPISPMDMDFTQLFDFLIMKGRYALVFPWTGMASDQIMGKDFYLVPFRPEDPTPEFIELLDEVHLPEKRTGNMLLGVFVLQKGRIVAGPSPPAPVPAPLPTDIAPTSTPQPTTSSGNTLPIASLESLIPGGLTDQHKTLLQSLMSSQAVTSSLAQQQMASMTASPTTLAPQQQPFQPQYSGLPPLNPNPVISPPHPFPGSSTPYGAHQPHVLPPAMGYGGYSGENSAYQPGPPSASYGPPIHMSRQMNMMDDRNQPPPRDGRPFQGDYGRGRGGYDQDRPRRFSEDRGGHRGLGRGRGNSRGGRGDSRGRDRGWNARGGGWS
ncbi:hypothetical protein FRB98_006623 [Tulasnella sp. 332]|nr:hypothetical protein FRB98_006623 [Tulasnella sp. 332]